MNLIGKTTINPLLFYSGKISGYVTWIAFIAPLTGISVPGLNSAQSNLQTYVSLALAIPAFILITVSLMNLGKSTRLGLPKNKTELKTHGVYKLSRNPMYLGFNLLTISSMVFTLNLSIIVLGVYSIWVYHLIIIGEEKFLQNRFGNSFINYKKRSRRYL
ncbi:Protein-S-isoprenylcysteine O-methyltransferase Ste14 [Mariniphaga anaerophila]|uniref:Protein-S-isoprenylcysteine O-methyltransferase Ste14 n=2 Tax=Mariniphaga anaerophila TaxID=1484053 RepID=A0A1M4TIQ8_9BACT|nr:Protein-S-isoprenylcysteine O-methyltransferase Ste14 [Mariniphaga anaerophila]